MVVTCSTCQKIYDDTYTLTLCPHEYFEMNTYAIRQDGSEKLCHTLKELHEWLHSKEHF